MDEELEKRIKELEAQSEMQGRKLNNLVEYLERVDERFKTDPGTFDDWEGRLAELRRDEVLQRKIKEASAFLRQHDYIVAADESELDAQKLRNWVDKKRPCDI